ncbi:MAG: IS3 family transposase, partial [Mogibacterium sp.]|nr:IS3 family transposase [Mogibacterium sp.]
AALIASGVFYAKSTSVAWKPEIRHELLEKYPGQSFEEGILRLGLTPEIVGTQRIGALKQSARQELKKKAAAEQIRIERLQAIETAEELPEADAFIYIKHPYVEEVTDRDKLTMTENFFSEAVSLKDLPIEDVLKVYEIDASLIKRSCMFQIQQELLAWNKSVCAEPENNDQTVRIQSNRMQALTQYTEKQFGEMKCQIRNLIPLQKKELCRQIAEYPTSLNYPHGYSLREILSKIGISKTTYYKALGCSGYGMAEELRRERDARDLEIVMRVATYKGFEKGIRQIYMMMPDITGEQFAISKIRRLLRNAGIKTKVRGENPARQRAREFHERNTKPNLLKREFRLHRPNEVRLTDVTYLDYGRTDDGEKQRAYGSSCIDPVTGKLMAFNVSENNDVELALETLARLSEHPTMIGALFHSDQGILYLTDEFQKKVAEMGMVQSMSKRGNCWDNAPQESFFGHFKDECNYEKCETFEELKAMIDEYAYYYNHERHQWSRGRMTPVEYEKYMQAMTDEEFAAYMEAERAKYANMKKKAEKKAIERAKTLGV